MDIFACTVFMALGWAVRYPLLGFESGDFAGFTKHWYAEVQRSGASSLSGEVSNYAPIYMLLLYVVHAVAPTLEAVKAVKVPSLVSDLVCAAFVYLIVRERRPGSARAPFAFAAALLSPTAVLNSAYWGQADSIYTAALLGCVYGLLRRRDSLACVAFAIAFSFKAQAVFLTPLLMALVMAGRLGFRQLAWIPIMFILSLSPAALAGRPWKELLTIYWSQAHTYHSLSMNAPTAYTWLSDTSYALFAPAGTAWCGAIVLCLVLALTNTGRRVELRDDRLVQLAFVSVIVVPFALPKMHERYYFPADQLSLVYGALFPEHAGVSIAMVSISLLSYGPFLFSEQVVPMPQLAAGILVLLVVVIRKFASDLRQAREGTNATT